MKSVAWLVVLVLLVPANLSAQRKEHEPEPQTPEAERSASDAHSFMELFTKLERDWMRARQRRDRNALEDILAPEFIVRTSSDPEHPVGRADWIQDALTDHQTRFYDFRAMTIRAFLGVAIVSFVQSEQATISGKISNTDSLIVDIWEANHGKWQPTARFVAPVEKR
jgi:hypothetical protein